MITGQKVWTTFAHYAKWCMLVARTDPDAPKHKGLTYFLLDMEQAGVEVRGLRQITGEAEFNELFFNEAFVADGNLIGEVNGGWKVAITTLMNERAGIGFRRTVDIRNGLDELTDQARERGLLDDPYVLDRIGDLYARTEVLRLTSYRGLTTQMQKGAPGPEGSLPKWMWSDVGQETSELAADLFGAGP